MKQASKKNSHHIPHFEQLSHRLREGGMILFGAIAVFLLVSLLTYHHSDPGWSTTGSSSQVANAGGFLGAWMADLLLYAFGYAAFLIPAFLGYWGWHLVWAGYQNLAQARRLFYLRITSFLLLLLCGSGFIGLQLGGFAWHLPFQSGGIIGTILANYLWQRLNMIGASIILLAFAALAIMFFSGYSWFDIFGKAGEAFLKGLRHLQAVRQARAMKHQYTLQSNEERLEPELAKSQENVKVSKAKAKTTAAPIEPIKTETLEPSFSALEPSFEIEPELEPFIALEEAIDSSPSFTKPEIIAPAVIEPSISVSIVPPFTPEIKPEVIIPAPPPTPTSPLPQVKKAEALIRPKTKTISTGALPPLDLLDRPEPMRVQHFSPERLEATSRDVELRLKEFGVEVHVVAVHPGPVVTRYEMQLAPGVKVSRISSLAKDLARSLSVVSVRIVEVIPGKTVVGLEIPNERRETVRLREILASPQYEQLPSPLALSLGKDIAGHPVIVDLGRMPHLLVAGTTGSGKSVGLNAMLLGLLYKSTPEEVRMILVDPKMLELSIYEGIPHLLAPVVTDMKEAANALRWCVAEMERRYRILASVGVRNLAGYNQKVKDAEARGEPLKDPLFRGLPGEEAPALESMPYIVVVIDEFADMIMVVGKKVEQLIARIAQKARAAGIHLILATQRPSVDVITGLIKANIPTRIAFQVSSKIDSRTVLDQGGAEQLLGHGDMLYLPPGTSVPVRVHGAFVADDEVHRVVEDWRGRGAPDYIEDIICERTDDGQPAASEEGGTEGGETDPLYDQAVHIVTLSRKASISNLQRRLKIGYNRAARLIEDMEAAGIVSAMESNGSREVLAPPPPNG